MKKEEIIALAKLARIAVSDEEAESLKTDIDAVLEYVSVVQDITGTGQVEKTLTPRYNVMRDDVVTNTPDQYTEALLEAAPKRKGRFLEVNKILHAD
ncbi:Asp-tRNA(Asn)/Glu-tRNA(Gln) amidotransferase subunit GatC [Candidatus Kaiserbacteria bacterium]|nr:Asp-tRNA(Asn)/Glu-tRNA(Gln) amidotransferase subunit GatC [Candidatus Kaiserbacteria bacterium]